MPTDRVRCLSLFLEQPGSQRWLRPRWTQAPPVSPTPLPTLGIFHFLVRSLGRQTCNHCPLDPLQVRRLNMVVVEFGEGLELALVSIVIVDEALDRVPVNATVLTQMNKKSAALDLAMRLQLCCTTTTADPVAPSH